MDQKTCTKCKLEQPIEGFSYQSKKTGKRSGQCKSCMSELIKSHYEKNKKSYLENNTKRRLLVTSEIIKLKEASPCMDCKRHYPYYVMDFDHRDPSTKIDGIARLIRSDSLQAVLREVTKCDLVCANCHRVRTYTRQSWKTV
jgi:hypothetical protein